LALTANDCLQSRIKKKADEDQASLASLSSLLVVLATFFRPFLASFLAALLSPALLAPALLTATLLATTLLAATLLTATLLAATLLASALVSILFVLHTKNSLRI
jgi:hypothetical protein